MTANRNLKARTKASPSKIQQDIRSAQAIVNREIVDNDILHIAESPELSLDDLPDAGPISVPLNLWLEHATEIQARGGITAVQLAADEDAESLSEHLDGIDMVVLPFVSHADGRPYTHAYKLRTRFKFTGQIRAIGDVKFDQLDFLSRVGCDAFELPEGEDLQAALHAFGEFSDVYQPAADNRRLIFSRRRAIH